MNILLLGSGGRENALAWKIAQSERVEKLFVAPGNAGTQSCGTNVPIKADDFAAIKDFVVAEGIDMVVVGPEDPLVKGIYDELMQSWRAAKTLPRDSCSATTYLRHAIRPSTAIIWPKALPF